MRAISCTYSINPDGSVTIADGWNSITLDRKGLEVTIVNIKRRSFETEFAKLRQLKKYEDALAFLLGSSGRIIDDMTDVDRMVF